ncbi:hypothetical protein DFH06DRAFT_1182838, partial [Mycena polygramma]
LCKIFDFKNQAVNLAFNDGMNGVPIISFPETPGAPNEDWFIIPQPSGGTFTLQSVAQSPFFVSQAGVATGFSGHYSQAVASSTFPTVFTMQAVNGGPAINLIDSVTGLALTSWVNPDPTTWADPSTPLTMETFNMPKSFMQSFTITLCHLNECSVEKKRKRKEDKPTVNNIEPFCGRAVDITFFCL